MDFDVISAVVFAAGQSKRMGQPKMLLPWESTTVIGRVVSVLAQAGLEEILVVTGAVHPQIEHALKGLRARIVYNPDHAEGEMRSSAQLGLASLSEEIGAALITLGDQPQIEPGVVRSVIAEYHRSHAPLVVPSYKMRRGHPWILSRSLWPAAMKLRPPSTLRDLVRSHADLISYVVVDTPSVLEDMDTPEDYRKQHPRKPEEGE